MADIHVHYEGVDNAGEALGAATKAIEQVLEDCTTTLNTVKNQWYGNSADQYVVQQNAWNTATDDMNTKLAQNTVNLSTIRENYSQTDNGLALTWGEIGGITHG
ncbi:MAG TPA: WXG100 family type VII secretion target [Actinocatenispora sp.]